MQHKLFAKLSLGLITAAVLSTSYAHDASADWFPEAGNLAHTNHLAMQTNPQHFRVIWQKRLALGEEVGQWWMMGGSFNIANGSLFYSLNHTTPDARSKIITQIIALNTSDGATQWIADHKYSFVYPVYWQGKIIASAGYDKTSQLDIYDAKTGHVISSMPTPDHFGHVRPYGFNMYVQMGCDSLASFNMTNFKFHWTAPVPNQGNTSCEYPVVTSEYMLSTKPDGVRVFDRRSGKTLFDVDIPNVIHGNYISVHPVYDAKTNSLFRSYMEDDGSHLPTEQYATLYAIDLNQRAVRWMMPMMDQNSQPVVVDGTVYAVNGFRDRIYALNAVTGKIEWSWKPSSWEDKLYYYHQMVATSDVLFVRTKTQTYAVSLKTHKTIWKIKIVGDMSLGDGKLFILSGDDMFNHQDKLGPMITAISLQ